MWNLSTILSIVTSVITLVGMYVSMRYGITLDTAVIGGAVGVIITALFNAMGSKKAYDTIPPSAVPAKQEEVIPKSQTL